MPEGKASNDRSLSPTGSTSSDLGLKWLFDPSRRDHLPIEEQLKFYKTRDLREVKIYRIATQLWGKNKYRRTRKFIASSMPGKTRLSYGKPKEDLQDIPPEPPTTLTKEETTDSEENEKLEEYEKWLQDRKSFRKNLDNMGLNEEWLRRKPNKTELEKRLLAAMEEASKKHVVLPTPIIRIHKAPQIYPEVPLIRRPTPTAICIIEKFLFDKKMRLLDLFAYVDKNKTWHITRKQFREAMVKAKVPISQSLMDDLIQTLDTDLTNSLDYRELARGMRLWKVEKREIKWKRINDLSDDTATGQTLSGSINQSLQLDAIKADSDKRDTSGSPQRRVTSALSTLSSNSYLQLPTTNLEIETFQATDETKVYVRKRLKYVTDRFNRKICHSPISLKESVIKTGEKAVDDHSMLSVLSDQVGYAINKFREHKLKEYEEIVDLCRKNRLKLTEKLLGRAILYPADRLHEYILSTLHQPSPNLLSSNAIEQPHHHPKSPVQEKTKRKSKRSHIKPVMVDSRHAYPTKKLVNATPTKMSLSTGKAFVRRKIDCWLTFEEYEELTRHLPMRLIQPKLKVDDDVFWPGKLLEKMRLCMPDLAKGSDVFFEEVKRRKPVYPGYNNDLAQWVTNDSGYLQEGILDIYKNKFI